MVEIVERRDMRCLKNFIWGIVCDEYEMENLLVEIWYIKRNKL